MGVILTLYVIGMYGLSLWAHRRIQDPEDFLLAGRRLSLPLASATLLATWFGAATLLTAADEVRHRGLERIALEPLGSGVCLLLAGFFLAGPLWKMKLLTLSDFFRVRFGPIAEVCSACILVPSYFGWIAVQFIALAGILELFFGIDARVGILVVAVVGGGYTWLGGMWSVTLTDAVQIALVLTGLLVLAAETLSILGQGNEILGFTLLLQETPSTLLNPFHSGEARSLVNFIGLFAIGALGNLAGQDLMQRVFSARSAAVARGACWVAGAAYLLFGMLPVFLGLASRLLIPGLDEAIVPALARMFLSPVLALVFVLAVVSAVLSTIDSAVLAPASLLARNVFTRLAGERLSLLSLTRLAVILVTVASVLAAYLGESAYSLLEDAYALPLVGLLAPLLMGAFRKPRNPKSALAAMAVGTGLWLLHYTGDWDLFLEPLLVPIAGMRLPMALTAAVFSLGAYLLWETFVFPGGEDSADVKSPSS